MNYSNLTMDLYETTTYNTGCISELEKVTKICQEFKLDVISNGSLHFKITIIFLAILIFYYFYIKKFEPKFSQTELYKNKVAYRIDFIIMMTTLIMIAYLFM